MNDEEIINNIQNLLGRNMTIYSTSPITQTVEFLTETDRQTIITLLDKYLTLKNKFTDLHRIK